MIKNKLPIMIICLLGALAGAASYAHDSKDNNKQENWMFKGTDSTAAKVVTQFHKALRK
jgi:hypothetical protein